MAEINDSNDRASRGSREDDPLIPVDAPYGHEQPETSDEDVQRRTASARFDVASQVGSEAMIRGAMDPANQSMAEALRLSYRVLQLVILVLVALFLVSSVQTVDDDQGGVFTRWGAIVPLGGDPDLSPGLKWGKWPYPIGEFILFNISGRTADVGNAFVPSNPRGATLEALLDGASVDRALTPPQDGSLLTRDGDLAHMRVSARYSIDPATRFVEHINDAEGAPNNANEIVRLALQQATVHTVAAMTAQDVTDRVEEAKAEIKQRAQQTLDQLQCGITLAQIDIRDNGLPFSIQKVNGDLQQAQLDAEAAVETARTRAEQTLIGAAGSHYRQIVGLIDKYEDALEVGDEAESSRLLTEINTTLESPDVVGEVANIISYARTYLSLIESNLGGEVQRFLSLLPAFRENPQLVIRKQWMEAYAHVLSRPDVEIMYVPDALGTALLVLNGSNNVRELRQKMQLDAKERKANQPTDLTPFIKRGSDTPIRGPGRQLNVGEGGKAVGTATPSRP